MSVNLEQLIEFFDNDKDLILEMLEVFESTYTEYTNGIDTAIANQDNAKLELNAHTLKGSFKNFFDEELVNLACQLEKLGKEGRVSETTNEVNMIKEKTPLMIETIKKRVTR